MAPDALDHGLVADAQAQQEAVGVGLGHRLVGGAGGHGVTGPDRGDAGGDHDVGAAPQQQGGVGEGLPAHGLGHPHGPVPELVELVHVLDGPRRRHQVELEGPDADASDVEGGGHAVKLDRPVK